MREEIKESIEWIHPFDAVESLHISDTFEWLDTSEEVFRITKPATPDKHLVSYFVLIDRENKKILLVNHILSGLWLPTGGHVKKDENPKQTVEREITEELNISADFILEEPFFLTQNVTVGKTAGHTDVSLWYILHGDSTKKIMYDSK